MFQDHLSAGGSFLKYFAGHHMEVIIIFTSFDEELIQRKLAERKTGSTTAGLVYIEEKLDMIGCQLSVLYDLMYSLMERPALPNVPDPDEPLRVAAYRKIPYTSVKQDMFIEDMKSTEIAHIAPYPNWELTRIYIDRQYYHKRSKDVFHMMMEDARNSLFDLIITDSTETFSTDIEEVINVVDFLRNLPHPVHVLFERYDLYTKTDYEGLLALRKGEAYE